MTDIRLRESPPIRRSSRARPEPEVPSSNLRKGRVGSRPRTILWLVGSALLLASAGGADEAPRTLRVDYFHTGSASEEIFSLDRVVVEPLPWPGNPDRPIDTTGYGKYRFEIRHAESDRQLYSRGFASIYGEWETTGEARERHRTFHESVRFPAPEGPVTLVIEKRGPDQRFTPVWSISIDPTDVFVDSASPPPQRLLAFQDSGDPGHKVDLLLMGDGYTAAECSTFEDQARRLTEALFEVSPFRERRSDFNVWGLCPPAAESGVARPSTGIHRRSPLGATYDAFGSERYVLSFENRRWREVAAWAPYDAVEILVNSETYGGGGIFGLYSTAAAANDWAEYLFIHEFGHHFAALADEYYTSSVAYEIPEDQPEPWEVNATLLEDPEQLKWRHLATPGVELPTPWPQVEYEEHSRAIQERRRQLRAAKRPESEMSALFHEQQAWETALFEAQPTAHSVGAFEGANYVGRGMYRPQLDCIMFSRNPVPFCAVCQHGIETVIDLYTSGSDAGPDAGSSETSGAGGDDAR